METLDEIKIKFEQEIKDNDFKKEDFPRLEKLIKLYHILLLPLKNGYFFERKYFIQKTEDKYGNNKSELPTIDIILKKDNNDRGTTILYHNREILVRPYHIKLWLKELNSSY